MRPRQSLCLTSSLAFQRQMAVGRRLTRSKKVKLAHRLAQLTAQQLALALPAGYETVMRARHVRRTVRDASQPCS